jgi:hypothetical protein
MKLWKRMIGHNLRKLIIVSNNQFDFVWGFTMKAIFYIRRLVGRSQTKELAYNIY